MSYRPHPGDPYVEQPTEPEPTVTVEPKSWAVEVGGKQIGSVSRMPSSRWLALHGPYSKDIGSFGSKDEAVAAVLAYVTPKVCTTCRQVVA